MLIIQKPGTGELLNQLNIAAEGAIAGGGAFAFASKAGVEALLDQENILTLANTNEFILIVGVDAVTNLDAIKTLQFKQESLPGLNVKIFCHDNTNSTFHPKFCWFQRPNNTILIAGSGNLTYAGLGGTQGTTDGNWEAFTIRQLFNDDANPIHQVWETWIEEANQQNLLHEIDDDIVIKKAVNNSRVWPTKVIRRVSKKTPASKTSIPVEFEAVTVEGSEYANKAQIVEISRNRWPQADLGQSVLCNFFGFDEKSHNREILIQHVNSDNSLGEIEKRHMILNQSRNYRFELGAGRGLEYAVGDNDDRPLVVFVQLGSDVFRYHLLMPDSETHKKLIKVLGNKESGSRRVMRKKQINIEKLLELCPKLPSLLFPTILENQPF